MNDRIVGAAVYFDPALARPVSVGCVEEVFHLLALSQLPIRELEIVGAKTLYETELLSDAPTADRLRAVLASEPAKSVSLWCRDSDTAVAIRQQAVAQMTTEHGFCFLGLPVKAGLDMKGALLATYRLSRMLASPSYGIGYLCTVGSSSLGYAIGNNTLSGKPFPAPEELQTKDLIFKWRLEMMRDRRYLRGRFRSVYPVQIVSEAHRQAKLYTGHTVDDIGLGTWTPLDDGMWLWELTDGELPHAEAALEQSGLLIAA